MSPTDPRHGTYAGYLAHYRAGQNPCDPCDIARRRQNKRTDIRLRRGIRHRIPIGDRAWNILNTHNGTQLAAATGINLSMIYRLKNEGPDRIVLRSTRDRILGAQGLFTPLGIQRRLRALGALGWSAGALAKETGICRDAIQRLRTRRDAAFVRTDIAHTVIAAYDRLSMTLPPEGRSSWVCRAHAKREGWVAPLAWDDIDYDPEPWIERSSRRPGKLGIDLDEFDYLVSCGESEEQAARRLGVTLGAIEMARLRARKVA